MWPPRTRRSLRPRCRGWPRRWGGRRVVRFAAGRWPAKEKREPFEIPNLSSNRSGTPLANATNPWQTTSKSIRERLPCRLRTVLSRLRTTPSRIRTTPSRLQTNPESIQPDPESIQADPESIQTDPELIQPDPESIQTDPESIQSDPESIQTDSESIQTDSESIQTDSESIRMTWNR